ncbi:MAG: hypothetical protein RIG62_09460 [Cyclobacteriaceae bacterium]
MKFPKFLSMLFFLLALTTMAVAHPGHGSNQVDPHSVLHYLTSLVHLIPLVTVLGIILFAILKKRTESATSRRNLRK